MSSYRDQRDERVSHGLAIINPYGGIWTDEIFEKPEDALRYLKAFWNGHNFDASKWRLALATQTITLDRHPGEPTLLELPAGT
jgi:hypothetical protein